MYEIVSCQRMLTVVLKESQKLIQKVLPPYRFEAIKNRKENIHSCEKKILAKLYFFHSSAQSPVKKEVCKGSCSPVKN